MSEASHSIQEFWGKFASPTCYLPLAAHCLDVAMVFRALCDLGGIARSLSHASDVPLSSQLLDRLAVIAMLHDIGKANLGFQMKVFDNRAPKAGHIRELAPILDIEVGSPELASRFLNALPPEFASWFRSDEDAYSYLLAALSHHGQPIAFQGERPGWYWLAANHWWRPQNDRDPMEAISEIGRWAREAFPDAFVLSSGYLPSRPAFQHRFAGLLMLADWIGSHPAWFPIRPDGLDHRLAHNRWAVPQVVQALGLDPRPFRPVLGQVPPGFEGRFERKPRPLQTAISDLNPDEPGSELVIAESETGSGKTEAALDWFFSLFHAGKVDSLYFALPSRVAARELYSRVDAHIRRWFPDPELRPVTLLAVPGYTKIDGEAVSPRESRRLLPTPIEANHWQDDESIRLRERTWAAERPKRFLAATVAVGTIDQALLSIVQTPHAHLRSVCLDRSLLVVDEVHASDQYMSTLLTALLDHHLSVGGRAMLLSATLGSASRHSFLNCRSKSQSPAPTLAEATAAPYPSLTLADGTVRPTGGWTKSKSVLFEEAPVAFSLEALCDAAAEAVAAGARVIVVFNTVGRANQFLRLLQSDPRIAPTSLFSCNGAIAPHHGRFAPADRQVLDVAVSRRLGPGSPGGPLLLVGTQTVEQSLDIDADFMISDLAPADVLLQRVGRLHRHDRPRPSGYGSPARCLVVTPPESLEAALDERGEVLPDYMRIGYGSVYEDLRMLELTRAALITGAPISIPEDNRKVVEAVTHPECLASLESPRWRLHRAKVEGTRTAKAISANLATALYDQPFGTFIFQESGGRVATRLGADSLHLPLSTPFTSPFGQQIESMVIPGHIAPAEPNEQIELESIEDGTATLRLADRRYRYTRFGLEAIT